MQTFKKRKAISAAILTLILIGIAVGAGLLVYNTFQSGASTVSMKNAVVIEQVSLVKTNTGDSFLSLTVKNEGNKKFTSSSGNLQVDTNGSVSGIQPFSVAPSPQALNPGQSASVYQRVVDSTGAPITNLVIGQTIPIEVTATAEDGSTVKTSTSVMVSMA